MKKLIVLLFTILSIALVSCGDCSDLETKVEDQHEKIVELLELAKNRTAIIMSQDSVIAALNNGVPPDSVFKEEVARLGNELILVKNDLSTVEAELEATKRKLNNCLTEEEL